MAISENSRSDSQVFSDNGSPETSILGRFSRHLYATIYLLIALPSVLALCLLIGPFQVPDETAHFLRAIQLSHQQVMPVVSAKADAAGGIVERDAAALSPHFRDPARPLETGHRFAPSDVLNVLHSPWSPAVGFAAFSNTAIYFPLAHAVPAVVISGAREAGASPLMWMYAGRLANGLTAVLVSALAIALFEESGLFALVVCTLPMAMFEAASLSADALVIPCAVMIAALLARLARNRDFGWRSFGALMVCLLIVCVGKFAYVPLALLPPLVSTFQRRRVPLIWGLTALAVLALIVWGIWSGLVRHDIFSIREAGVDISVDRQLSHVVGHPLAFVATFLVSIGRDSVKLLEELVGSNLGWLDLKLPKPLVGLLLANLSAALLLNPGVTALRPASRIAIAAFAAGSFGAACLLLYLQYTPVGQALIDGLQGRYLLPLLPFAALVLPGIGRPLSWRLQASAVVMVISAASALTTLLSVWIFYWR